MARSGRATRRKCFLIDEEAAGLSISAKINEVRTALKLNKADYHFISSLDDIAWLFNLRGKDVDYNPVTLSFALITPAMVKLFIDKKKLSQTDISTLNEQGVTLHPYGEVAQALKSLPKICRFYRSKTYLFRFVRMFAKKFQNHCRN